MISEFVAGILYGEPGRFPLEGTEITEVLIASYPTDSIKWVK
jgi:hypothetical protein